MPKEKGFIGPIGDDLPSLIPLIFALMIFFSSFNLTFQTYTQTLEQFNRQIQVAEINKVLREDGYFSSFTEFRNQCEAVNLSGVYYRAGLLDPTVFQQGVPLRDFVTDTFIDPTDIDRTKQSVIYRQKKSNEDYGKLLASGEEDERRFVSDERLIFNCHNLNDPNGKPYEGERLAEEAGLTFDEAQNKASNTVPVVLEDHAVESGVAVRPMHLVVVVWT